MPLGLVCLFVAFGFLLAILYLVFHGSKSDAPELLTFAEKLLPAGHCLCQSSTTFDCASCLDCATGGGSPDHALNNTIKPERDWAFRFGRDAGDLGLDTSQCLSAFPGLFEDITRATAFRAQNHIQPAELMSFGFSDGMVRAMVYDRELYILEVRFKHHDHRKKGLAALHAMQRAIMASPRTVKIPNIEFVFSVEDMLWDPGHPIWVFARKSRDHSLWLMPDFGFWSWPIPGVGCYSSIVADVIDREAHEPFESKLNMLVWRGKPSYAPKLRRALMDAAKNKPWSAVSGLQWTDSQNVHDKFMSPSDQCRYMFIAHAEGRSYSGSLKYRQLCRSVVVSHKLQWIQHHHYLLIADGAMQNYVEVERDFSNLEAAMEDLLTHPKKARRIANNNVKTFRERYLTPAAEAYYWRALFQGWAAVSFAAQLHETNDGPTNLQRRRGVRFETFAYVAARLNRMSRKFRD